MCTVLSFQESMGLMPPSYIYLAAVTPEKLTLKSRPHAHLQMNNWLAHGAWIEFWKRYKGGVKYRNSLNI